MFFQVKNHCSIRNKMLLYALKDVSDFLFGLLYWEDNLKMELQRVLVNTNWRIRYKFCILEVKILSGMWSRSCVHRKLITQKEKQHSFQNAAMTSLSQFSLFQFTTTIHLELQNYIKSWHSSEGRKQTAAFLKVVFFLKYILLNCLFSTVGFQWNILQD